MRRTRRVAGDAMVENNTSLMDILGNSLGGVLFLLVLFMVYMALLPKMMATLKDLRILPYGAERPAAIDLPAATLGEPYVVLFASEGGNEYVDFELADDSAALPPGLDWLLVEHSELSSEHPRHRTRVGLEGVPTGGEDTYELPLVATSMAPPRIEEFRDWGTDTSQRYRTSDPVLFRLDVRSPPVKRMKDVKDLRLDSSSPLAPTRLDHEGRASIQLAAIGGLPPYTWAVETETGAEVAISDSGLVTAEARAPQSLELRVTVTSFQSELLEQQGRVAEASTVLSWGLLPPVRPLRIGTPSVLPPAVGAEPYALALSAFGGTGVYRWSLASANEEVPLPAWVVLDEDLLLVDCPDPKGRSNDPLPLRLSVADEDPTTATVHKNVELRIDAAGILREGDPGAHVRIVTPSELPDARVGDTYALMLAAEGGLPPYRWEVVEGSGRANAEQTWQPWDGALAMSEHGLLAGTPEASGERRLRVRVTDARGGFDETVAGEALLLHVLPLPDVLDPARPLRILTPPLLPTATEGKDYRLALSADGGLPPYLWDIRDGLPEGLSFSSVDGFLDGRPESGTAGEHEFEVLLKDQRGLEASVTMACVLPVRPDRPDLRILTTELPEALVARRFEVWLATEGEAGRLVWSISEGRLPPGLELEASTGRIHGTPRMLDPTGASFRVRAAGAEASAERELSLAVVPSLEMQPLAILTEEELPRATAGSTYSLHLTARGGLPPYNWSEGPGWPGVSDGGIGLSRSGQLHGKGLSAPAELVLPVVVRDALGNQDSEALRLSVAAALPEPELKILTQKLPEAFARRPYPFTFATRGGTGQFTWELEGELPPGVRFQGGQLVGAPEEGAKGRYSFQLAVQDARGAADTASFKLTVQESGDYLDDWWKYFGFTLCLIVYLIFKQGINDRYFFRIRQRLMQDGLKILIQKDGAYVDGPDEVRRQYHALTVADRLRILALRVTAAAAGVWYASYLGLY